MGGPRRDHIPHERGLTLLTKLERLAREFRANLQRIQKVADEGEGLAKRYASEQTSGMPKKHVIATTFALCDTELARLVGRFRWRCSMSERRKKANVDVIRRVKTILAAVRSDAVKSFDDWPAIEEFMHDFSASTHSLPEVTGKDTKFEWDEEIPFKLVFVAESEMATGGPSTRQYAVTRDLVKLCLIECEMKAVVYRGYASTPRNAEKRASMVDALVRTIRRCPSPGNQEGGWLLIGLSGEWPDRIELDFHSYEIGADRPEERKW